jgi:hypothetical protein
VPATHRNNEKRLGTHASSVLSFDQVPNVGSPAR